MRYSSLAAILAAVLLSSCSGDSPQTIPRADTTEVDTSDVGAAPADTASNVSPADSLEWTTQTIGVDRSVPEPAIVRDFRAGRHQEYDRFVIEFQNEVIPGYDVSYLNDQPIECGSGEEISVEGSAVLEIRLEPARGHNEQGQSTVDHSERRFDLPLMHEAEVSCDFEAMFTVLVGLQTQLPYRVSELRNPARLVIDVRHAQAQ